MGKVIDLGTPYLTTNLIAASLQLPSLDRDQETMAAVAMTILRSFSRVADTVINALVPPHTEGDS
jgi:hypothetical protein